MIRHLFYLGLMLLLCNGVNAQGGEYYTNGKGEPFLKKQIVDAEGDPYFSNKWLPGHAQTTKGVVYDSVKLKYDLQDDVLIFAYDTLAQPMKFAEPIKAFTLLGTHKVDFANGYPAVDKQTPQSYYQVIATGKATLLKRLNKILSEIKSYNSSTVNRFFQANTSYYLYVNGTITKVDPKKAIYSLAANNKEGLDEYINSNSLSFKKDEDLAKMFSYYNGR